MITQPDKPRGRGQQITDGPVKSLAASLRLAGAAAREARARSVRSRNSRRCNADIGVVAAYGKILPDWLLAAPRLGLINVHASLLPRYRGASPVHRAVINGDAETGVTIMRVVKALDAGPMLAAARVPIGIDDTTTIVESMLAIRGAELLVADARCDRGRHRARNAAGRGARHLRAEAGKDRRPRRLDAEPGARIHNLIRGLWPWPHAYTYLGPDALHPPSLATVRPADAERGARDDRPRLGDRRPARRLRRWHRDRARRPPTRRQAGDERPRRDGGQGRSCPGAAFPEP